MRWMTSMMVMGLCWGSAALAMPAQTVNTLQFAVGDLVFLQIDNYIFRQVGDASNSWVNHVGVIVGHDGQDYLVAESTIPRAKLTPLQQFIARSKDGRFAIRRLPQPLDAVQQTALYDQAVRRLGKYYHTGFKLESERQFCSKFVYEVYRDALGVNIGDVETFAELLHKNPQAKLGFWRVWFGGYIPWQRKTVTPASEYADPLLVTAYESQAIQYAD